MTLNQKQLDDIITIVRWSFGQGRNILNEPIITTLEPIERIQILYEISNAMERGIK